VGWKRRCIRANSDTRYGDGWNSKVALGTAYIGSSDTISTE